MRDIEKINQVQILVSPEPSGWKEKAEFRKANRQWLKRSTEIALRILSELQSKGISQAELSRLMEVTPQQVSKLVKGQENLTLETIGRIELALNISLINVVKPKFIKDEGFHTLVENATISGTLEINTGAEPANDNVRPLYSGDTTYDSRKYYE